MMTPKQCAHVSVSILPERDALALISGRAVRMALDYGMSVR